MNMRTIMSALLDIVFPPKKGVVTPDRLTFEMFASLIAVSRDIANGTVSILSYQDALVRAAVHALKYNHQKHIADIFGRLLHDTLFEDVSDWISFGNGEPILVIPLPLSKERLHARGYNQAALIGSAFVKNIPSLRVDTSILQKIKDTPSQAMQESRQVRFQNIKNAFSVTDPSKVENKTIILIDDVITTGATMHEAMDTLKKAGAGRVYGICVAH